MKKKITKEQGKAKAFSEVLAVMAQQGGSDEV